MTGARRSSGKKAKRMSIELLKSILAIFFLIAGIVAALAMLISMGRTEKKRIPPL